MTYIQTMDDNKEKLLQEKKQGCNRSFPGLVSSSILFHLMKVDAILLNDNEQQGITQHSRAFNKAENPQLYTAPHFLYPM